MIAAHALDRARIMRDERCHHWMCGDFFRDADLTVTSSGMPNPAQIS
jgi:hypothetical protein